MTNQHVSINRDVWNADAENWVAVGERLWNAETPMWGEWGHSEEDLKLFPVDLVGKDVIELGCGTAYLSGWMACRGARVTGIDISARQLETARRLAKLHDVDMTLLEGNVEATGLDDEAFDFAISEYGAAIWCDPEVWLREAWRLLRPGGELVFLGGHPMVLLCTPENGAPCEFALHRPYRGVWGADWTQVEFDPGGVEFNLSISGWMELFREIGFVVQKYQELFAPENEEKERNHIPAKWAKAYPVEQVWHLRKPE